MSRYLIIGFSIAVLIIFGCKKTDCCKVPYYVNALKNNVQWQISANGYQQTDTLEVRGSNFSSKIEETFGFRFKFSGIGNYSLRGSNGFYYNTVGQDAVVSTYQLENDFSNSVTVTKYDLISHVVEGTFKMKLIKTYDNINGIHPDTLSFQNGKFRILQNDRIAID